MNFVTHISIIIVHYNTEKETTDCLRSLEKVVVDGFTHDIFVVDNGSQVPYEYQGRLENVSVLRSESNLGFTGGNNLGIHAAIERKNSDYVVLLNSDTIVHPKFLYDLLQHAVHHPRAGMISPKIYFAEGKEFFKNDYEKDQKGNVLWYAGGSIDWQHLVAFHRGVDEVDRGQFKHQLMSDFATGCCLFIRREVLEKIGLFDKNYFLYLEDVDLNIRIQHFGYEIHYCDTAKVWHINAGSTDGSGSIIHTYYQTRNRLHFFYEYGSWKVRLVVARLFFRYLFSSNRAERLGAFHFITRQLGKQPVI